MPYKSDAQRRFMHAKHPGIAAKWDQEIRAKKKGKVSKIKNEWTKAVVAGTAAGALANQFPRIQDIERERKRKAKKGQIKKMLVPVSSDPDFNQEAAQKAFDLVMKMDDDTAEMFTTMVVGDYFEETIEQNLGTLQRHLDETITKQLTDLKQAHLRLVSKGMDPERSVAYAQAIALLEKSLISKDKRPKTPQERGYVWRESDFRRDPSSGQFRTKISHNQTSKLKNSTFKQLTGADTPKEARGRQLSTEDQIRFQDEYRQLAGFLDAVRESTGGAGNQSVMLHYRDKNTGKPFSMLHTGTRPPIDDLADPNTRLVGVDAKPTTLTAGGAAFGLATALGGGMNPQQVKAINNVEGGGGSKFTQDWLASGDDQNSNAKLYGRLAASGEFLQATQLGPKTAMAGKFASIVGSAGPQAEAVLGPSARKTAYRYRGTEKTPERPLARAYGDAITAGKKSGAAPEEEEIRTAAQRGKGHGSMVAAGSKGTPTRRAPRPGEPPAVGQMARAGATLEERAPTWTERELGRRTAVAHLRNKMPEKSLYELQLASGNTPPSEGVIINADGQLVTQAIGYGDDHYLPFNLKNLKGLKGGEYIRTRSVGGLTSEDVYTGLIAGARQVTVTSRSGTYTMTFEEDFRGGRRHNDKARRMTRRYEQLLDAVQSQQVDRIDIDPEMRQQIETEVKEEMSGAGWTRRDQMEAIQERVNDFKSNPYITEQDEKRAEAIISGRAAGAGEKERAKIRAEVFDDLMEQKEVKFRLNSAGYKAAGDALREQFPYYIARVRWTPPKDEQQRIVTEPDKGYVEPGRNRPTAAQAGLYGTKVNQGQKYSASRADYQGATKAPGRLRPTEAPEAATAAKPADVHEARREKAAELELEYKASEVGTRIQASAKATLNEEALKEHAEALAMTPEELRDPVKQARFQQFANVYLSDANVKGKIGVEQDRMRREWEQAVGHRERKPFERETATIWPKQPAIFDTKPYKLGANETAVLKELDRVDTQAKAGVVTGLPLSHLSDKELEDEHRTLARMQEMLALSPGIALNPTDLERQNIDLDSPGLAGGVLRDPDKITDRLEQVQRARTLLGNLKPETRDQRAEASPQETKTVVHNDPTPVDQTLSALAGREAQDITMVRMALEREGDADQVEVKRLRDLADTLAASARLLGEPGALDKFKAEHQQDWDVYESARKRLLE